MRVAVLIALASLACANSTETPAPSDAGGHSDDVVTDVAVDPADVPDDVPSVPDVEDEADPGVEIPDEGPPEVFIPQAPATTLSAFAPALRDDRLVLADRAGVWAQLLGAPLIKLDSFVEGTRVSSPVIIDGLLCWDINGNGTFDPAQEDFDDDGAGTLADCAFHPAGILPDVPGAVVAVHPPGGTCELRAYTFTGVLAWTRAVDGECRQPARVGSRLLVPVAKGATGLMRVFHVRSGETGVQVVLPGAPTTSPVRVDGNRFVVGHGTGLAVVGFSGDPISALFVSQSISTDPERPTAVLPAGPGVVAAVFWRMGDPVGSLGRRLRRYDLDDNLKALPNPLTTPSAMWGQPVAAFIDDKWSIAAGGSGWVGAYEAETGAQRFLIPAGLGTVTGQVIGGDGRIYVSEIGWSGSQDEQGSGQWRLWSINPSAPESVLTHAEETETFPVRWLAPAATRCDLMAVQVVPDAHSQSEVEIAKPCANSLVGNGWARPFGDNENSGQAAKAVACGVGPGVLPCKSTSSCTINPDCDDENKCTIDSCVAGHCSYKVIPGCCVIDEHCEDFDLCTQDLCVDGHCQYKTSDFCCESSSECDDGVSCTDDVCEQGTCMNVVNPKLPGCCNSHADCVDGSPCTQDTCNAQKTCQNVKVAECCQVDKDCLDGIPCTDDVCVNGTCEYPWDDQNEGCCQDVSDCDDGNVCTGDACVNNACVHAPIEGCCLLDSECVDEFPCTQETCVANACQVEVVPTLPGCCETDEECKPDFLDGCTLSWACDPETAMCEYFGIICDDEDPCTADSCENGTCVFEPVGCCTADAECDDGNPCTQDICGTEGICGYMVLDGCCQTDDDCADEETTTSEQCINNACKVTQCLELPFEVTPAPVDVVVVVDQSTSMTEEIPLIRDWLKNFAAFAGSESLDYHVILIASRYQGANAVCVEEPLAGPNCSDSERFRQINKQVGSHNALALVMENIVAAEQFMRPGSQRHFLVFTDDFSETTAQAFDFFLASRSGYAGYMFHAVVGHDTLSCATGVGQAYLDLAQATAGVSADICGTDWTATYQKVGQYALIGNASFVLPMDPIDGTITVTHGGAPLTPGTQWTVDEDTGRIILLAPYPDSSTPVTICYDVQP